MQMLPKQLPGSTGTPSRVSSPAGTTQYTFSDQNAQPNSNRIAQTNPMVQQTSFQVDENGAPVVPEILRGNTNANPQSPASQFQPPETSNDHPALDDNSRKTPDDFASSMNQARGNLPRIAPDELASQSREIIAKMDELRRRTQDQKQAVNTPATTGQHGLESMRPSNPGAGEQANSSGQDLPGWSNATPTDSQRQPAERLAAERFAAIQADREDRTADDQEISASEFIGQVASSQPVTSAESSQQEDSAPMLVAKQQHDSSVASVTQLPNNPPAAQAVRDNQVRTASSEETTNQTNSAQFHHKTLFLWRRSL